MVKVIAFDADDTLWHNEPLYVTTQDKFKELLSGYHDSELIEQKLYEAETRNLHYFGYGIKGFALSMIETAVELTGGRIRGQDIQTIIDWAKEMQQAPLQLMAHVEETIGRLADAYPLMLITKGDLFDQETKLARSGLADYFGHVEIVSEKTSAAYEAILAKYRINPREFLMVGNSLRSDILPVVTIGGQGVYIPYHITWDVETVDEQALVDHEFFELEHIGLLPALVDRLKG